MPLLRLRPWPHPFSSPGPAQHTHPLALTNHYANPVLLQTKAERRFLGTIGYRLLGAGGIPPAATSAAPTASSTSSIRLLRRPPCRSLGQCRASTGSNDPGRGVGACFFPRHGSVKKIRRVGRRSIRLCTVAVRRTATIQGHHTAAT